ncbi:MAG: pyrroline-5-carboxylate reductase, partial [Clostridia bacterium]|nr:pyrroline-5-carboxylate reductase [Clostridia bacterium]
MKKYAVIGTGNMGGALARALCKKLPGENVILFNRTAEKAQRLAKELGCLCAASAAEAVEKADYILLGVKPYMMQGVIEGLKPALRPGHILVTMAPGITMDGVRAMAGGDYPVIRIMPNTPVSIGAGMTLYAQDKYTQGEILDTFLGDLAASGRFCLLPEHLMDAGSAVSGCGPAFADLFLEALADGGVACGLPRAQSYQLAAQMLVGAAGLALAGQHPGVLKDQVCSPGGTTNPG